MRSYVYIQSERPCPANDYHALYTVGFYLPSGEWCPESDYNTREQAAERCHWLNGGNSTPTEDDNENEAKIAREWASQ